MIEMLEQSELLIVPFSFDTSVSSNVLIRGDQCIGDVHRGAWRSAGIYPYIGRAIFYPET